MASPATTISPTGSSRAGFTLIELVIICVTLGILLAFSVPRLQPTAARLRLEQAAMDVAQWLRVARERAVSESRVCAWVWDEDERRMRIARVLEGEGDAGEVDVAADGLIIPAASPRLPEGMTIRVTREGQPVACRCVQFFPDGTSEPATVTVGDAERLFAVTVDDTTGHTVVGAGPLAR